MTQIFIFTLIETVSQTKEIPYQNSTKTPLGSTIYYSILKQKMEISRGDKVEIEII